MVGEWFLGTIIVLYIIFPIIRIGITKCPVIFAIMSTIFYVIFTLKYSYQMPILRNPLIRFWEFGFGAYYINFFMIKKSPKLRTINNIFVSVGCVLFLIIIFVGRFDNFHVFYVAIGGCSLFCLLMKLEKIGQLPIVKNLIITISKYSFSIFLVHHVIGQKLEMYFETVILTHAEYICSFIIYIILICIFSKLLFNLEYKVMNVVRDSINSIKYYNKNVKIQ